MIEISQGSIDNPFFNRETLSETPILHPTAVVRRSRMGAWTYLGAHCVMLDSDFHDYSYTGELVDIYNAEVGKFCNIAARVRINPTNHPMWRASLHHLTYRSHCYGMGEDDLEIFSWRQANRITIGHWNRGCGYKRCSTLYDRWRFTRTNHPASSRSGSRRGFDAHRLVELES
jgi:hypothetical protein